MCITYLSFRTDLILSPQNEIRKICLPSAQNEIFLSFRNNRILSTENDIKNLYVISFCVDLDNAKRNKKFKMKELLHYFKMRCNRAPNLLIVASHIQSNIFFEKNGLK